MSDNVKKKSFGEIMPTFNLIAMKDIKDKTTRKGSLRPLFDCVDSLAASVDALHSFLTNDPNSPKAEVVQKFLDHLTQMQIELLEMCKQEVQVQNRFDPSAVPVETESAEPSSPVENKEIPSSLPAVGVRPVVKR